MTKKHFGKFVTAAALVLVMLLGNVIGLVLTRKAQTALATTVEKSEGYNILSNSLNVVYDVSTETADWQLDGGYKITSSGNKIGNWGAYDGWTALASGGIRYDYQGDENGVPRVSRFYTMISNFTKGVAEISVTVDKFESGEIIDFSFSFWDVVSSRQVGSTDLTDLYNSLPNGNGQKISTYVDLSYIGSLDSMIFSSKADTGNVWFAVKSVDIVWGTTEIATSDGYFRGLENGFNIVFDKLTQKNTSKNFDGMPVTGFSNEYGTGYDSGRHGYYGFNAGSITAHNDGTDEYLRFGAGDNNCSGIWLKFPLDLSNQKVNMRVVLMKEQAGDCNEVKFEFLGANGVGNNPVTLSNASGLPDGSGLGTATEQVWITYDFKNIDLSGMTDGFDSLGIWVECSGAENQAIRLKNIAIYYDECGADREYELTESDREIDGVEFADAAGVSVKSDYKAKEYMQFDLGAAQNGITADYSAKSLADGKYKGVISFLKPEATGDSFEFSYATVKGNDIVSVYDLTEAVKTARTGEWVFAETQEFEVKNGAIDGFRFTVTGENELFQLEWIALVSTQTYIEADSGFGVAEVLTRDFTALNNMGLDEYDFSQNGFPEIGNWSDSFPDLRSQGQKVVRDTDGTPVMKIYRRTQAEIDSAKETFNWPEGTLYAPADKSHFFVTAPVSAGYFTLSITAKKGTNFKGTTDFSLEGYSGSEPWWKLANFTEELAEADVGEWVTYSADVYLPKAIDSIKILVETRYEDSDLFIKDVSVVTKSLSATGNYDGSKGGNLTWDLLIEGELSSVLCEGKQLTASDYSMTNNCFTLNESFLVTLANGSYGFVLSDGASEVSLTVFVSKMAPQVIEDKITVNIKRLEKQVVLSVDFKNSGVIFVEINGTELEEGKDFEYDLTENTLTLNRSAFGQLNGAGEGTLVIRTRAGETSYRFDVVSRDNTGLIIGLCIGGVALIGLTVAAVLILKKKKKNG